MQLEQRYGKQTKTGTSHLAGVTVRGYNYNGFVVVVGVLKGYAIFEAYSKKDRSKISDNDVAVLMNANSGGRVWTVDKSSNADTSKWVTEDGAILAELDKTGDSKLTVMTKEASDLELLSRSKK